MSTLTLRLAAALLGAVFTWSAVAKLLNFADWRAALARYALPEPLVKAALLVVPVVEAAVPSLFVSGRTRAAAALALFLLAAFSLAVLRARRAAGDKLPCGCFGKLKERDYRVTLVRNALLSFAAAILLVGRKDLPLFDGFAMPRGSEVLAAMLLIVGLSMSAWLLRSTGAWLEGKDRRMV